MRIDLNPKVTKPFAKWQQFGCATFPMFSTFIYPGFHGMSDLMQKKNIFAKSSSKINEVRFFYL